MKNLFRKVCWNCWNHDFLKNDFIHMIQIILIKEKEEEELE